MLKTRLTPIFSAIISKRIPLGLSGLLMPGLAMANPLGGDVTGGTASISSPAVGTTVIDQATQNAIIQWQSFDVGGSEYVIFNQPNASAAVLNRVIGGSPSEILGNIQANGRVFLVNPQGMVFGPGAQIDVGSLVATTLDIANSDFMQGRYVLNNPGSGNVSNAGDIRAANGGFVVLAGAENVSNTGIIAARLGDIVLASGSAMTLDLNGNGLVNFSINAASLSDKAGVANLGDLIAQGGTVIMTASTARELVGAAVNNSGRISAASIEERGGEIFLTASGPSADIVNHGSLDASGATGFDGGDILIQADRNVELGAASLLDITGRNGGTARVIAANALNVAGGSLIDGRADNPLLGRGGFVELSGHKSMSLPRLTDVVKLGAGGGLLIDPDDICITSGSALDCANSGTVVYESDIEGFLNADTDFYAIAANSIEVSSNIDDDDSDGIRALESYGANADLLLGIGTPAGSGPGNLGFSRSTPSGTTSPYGSILFQGALLGYGIDIAGSVNIQGGLGAGPITVGDISAESITIVADGATSTRNLTAQAGFVSVDTTIGDLTLAAVSATGGNVSLIARGGHLSTGDISASENYYTTEIDLLALGAVTTGALTVTDTDTSAYPYSESRLDITANNSSFGAPLGGDIRVNGAINVGATTSTTGYYATAYVNFYNASGGYSGTGPYIGFGGGGNIILNGPVNVAAAGTGLQNNAYAALNFYNSSYFYDYDAAVPDYVYVGGSVSTGAINVIAQATAHDPTDYPDSTTLADASVYSTSEFDFSSNGNLVTVRATGGDANASTNAPSSFNDSSLDIQTQNGGDILLGGGASIGLNGDLNLNARTGRDAGSSDYGNISTGLLSSYGGGDFDQFSITSSGDTSFSNTTLTANNIVVDVRALSAVTDLTALAGSVDLITRSGDLTLGTVSATGGNVSLIARGGHLTTGDVSAIENYYTTEIDLLALGSVTTGALTVTDTNSNYYDETRLDVTANNSNFGTPLGGDITVNGAVTLTSNTSTTGYYATAYANFYNASAGSYYDTATSQYIYYGNGGNIVINGPVNISATGTGLQNNAYASLSFNNSTYFYDYDAVTPGYVYVGGGVSTGAINVIAQATAHDPTDSPESTTLADASVYSTSEFDFNSNGNLVTVQATGGDANASTNSPSSFNDSSLEIQTQNGGDILLGGASVGLNGDINLNARSGRNTGSSDYGNVSTGLLSSYGGGDFDQFSITSSGATSIGNPSLTANNIFIDVNSMSTLNGLTALAGSVDVTTYTGDLNLAALSATGGGVYVQARGGHLTTGDVSVSEAYYNSEIDLQALGAVTTGALTITDTDADGYSYASARLGITANNASFGVSLGGDITVNGAVNVGANTSATGYQADAHVNFYNAGSSYYYDTAAAQYIYYGAGGNIVINGPVNVTAAGTGLQNNAYASLSFNNSTYFYDYDAVTPSYVYVGGGVSTGAINVIAQATAHDPTDYPDSTTLADASVYSTSEFDFNSNGNLVTVQATGGDANASTNSPSSFNDSSLDIQTQNGGDILLGGASIGLNGDINLEARSGRDAGSSDYGNISTGTLSGYGGFDLDEFSLFSSGATAIGNSSLTANNIYIDVNSMSTLNGLTALAGSLDVTTHTGDLSLGNLSATGGDVQVMARGGHLTTGSVSATNTNSTYYYSSGAQLFALGGITTGALTVTQTNDTGYSYRYAYLGLYANEDSFGTPIGGDITVNGAINVGATTSVTGHSVSAEAIFYNVGTRYVGVDPSTGAAVYAGAGGDININGPINIVAAGTGLQNDADVYLDFYNSSSYGNYVYNPETASYGYVYSQVGGGINLGGPVTLLAQATANDPDNYPGNTTYASAELYSDSLFDFNANGNLITLHAQGGDALSNTYPANYSYLYVETEYGGDILLGDVSLSSNGGLDLYTDSAYDNLGAVTDYGNISTGLISGYGEGDFLDYISVYSDGTLTTPNISFTANDIYLEAAQGNLTFDSLTALDGEVYVYADNGNVNLSGLTSSNNDDVYLYGINVTTADVSATNGRVYINAFGGDLTTGNVTSTANEGSYYYNDAYIDLGAFGGVTVNGNLTATTDGSGAEFYYPSADIYVSANQNYGDGAPGGGDIFVSGNISATVTNTSGSGYYDYGANASVSLLNNTNSYYTYDPIDGYTYHNFYGGGISTGAITVTAIGYPQPDPELYGTTYANAELDIRANQSITTNGNSITVIADGADSNASRIEIDTDHGGGDILLGNVTLGRNGDLSLEARTDEDDSDGMVNVGHISTGTLSTYGEGDQFNDLNLYSSGTLTTPHDSFTANNITIEVGQGDVSFDALTALEGGVGVYARGGNLILGDVSSNNDSNAQYYYNYAYIDLSALGSVTTGSLTVTNTDSVGYYSPYATLSVQANDIEDSPGLGGDITINGAVTVSALGTSDSEYIQADAYFGNASIGYSYDESTGDFLGYYGSGGNININGPINISAIATGPQSSANTSLELNASNSFYDSQDEFTGTGGAVTTGAITLTSTATAHDPVNCVTCTSYATGEVAISAEGDIRIQDEGGDADITVSTSGGDANGNAGVYNDSSIFLGTYNGGDIIGGNLIAQPGGYIELYAASDRDTGTDLGNISLLSAQGGPEALRALIINATGDVTLLNAAADDFILDDSNGDVFLGNITTFNGEIDITVRQGSLQTGDLTANQGGISLDAAGGIFTGALRASNPSDPTAADITVTANHDLGFGTYGGDINIGGAIQGTNVDLSNPLGSVFAQSIAGRNVLVTAGGGDIYLDSVNSTGDVLIQTLAAGDIGISGDIYGGTAIGDTILVRSGYGNVTLNAIEGGGLRQPDGAFSATYGSLDNGGVYVLHTERLGAAAGEGMTLNAPINSQGDIFVRSLGSMTANGGSSSNGAVTFGARTAEANGGAADGASLTLYGAYTASAQVGFFVGGGGDVYLNGITAMGGTEIGISTNNGDFSGSNTVPQVLETGSGSTLTALGTDTTVDRGINIDAGQVDLSNLTTTSNANIVIFADRGPVSISGSSPNSSVLNAAGTLSLQSYGDITISNASLNANQLVVRTHDNLSNGQPGIYLTGSSFNYNQGLFDTASYGANGVISVFNTAFQGFSHSFRSGDQVALNGGSTINAAGPVANSVLIEADNIDTPDNLSANNITLIAHFNPNAEGSTGQIFLDGVLTGNLTAEADVHFDAFEATLTGGTASITVNGLVADSFGSSGFYNSTVNYDSLQVSSSGAGSTFFVSGSQVNGSPSAYGGAVSITSGNTRIVGSEIHAGVLNLNATLEYLDVVGGSVLSFNSGTFTSSDSNALDGISGGDLFIGNGETGDATLQGFSSLMLEADRTIFIDNASVSGGNLNATAETQFAIRGSELNLNTVNFSATGSNPDAVNFPVSQISGSSLSASGSMSFSAAGTLEVLSSEFNELSSAPVSGQDLSFTAAALYLTGVDANSHQFGAETTAGSLDLLGDSSLNYVDGSFTAAGGYMAIDQSVALLGQTHDFNGAAGTANYVSIRADITGSAVNVSGGIIELGAYGSGSSVQTDDLSVLAQDAIVIAAHVAGGSATLEVASAVDFGIHLDHADLDLSGTLVMDSAARVYSDTSSLQASNIQINSNGVFDSVSSSFSAPVINIFAVGDAVEDISAVLTDSDFIASSHFRLDGDLDVNISGGNIGVPDLLQINAGGDLLITDGASMAGGTVQLFAGGSAIPPPEGDVIKNTAGEPGILLLNGNITAGILRLTGLGGVQSFGTSTLSADAMDVLGAYIDLGASTINVGAGLSALGFDPDLLSQLNASGLVPASASPNASFLAFDGDVKLGDVNLFGDYLFVSGDAFDFNSISFADSLFLNYAPSNSTAPMDLTGSDFSGLPNGVTLAFGSSSYTGDILASTPDNFIDVGQADTNFIFATAAPGTVTGQELIRTNGRVVGLNSQSEASETAETIASVISEDLSEIFVEQTTDESASAEDASNDDDDEEESGDDSSTADAEATNSGITVEDSSGEGQDSSGCGN